MLCIGYGREAAARRVRGSVSADGNPSSGADFIRATFSHKGRRKKAQFDPNLNLPSSSR